MKKNMKKIYIYLIYTLILIIFYRSNLNDIYTKIINNLIKMITKGDITPYYYDYIYKNVFTLDHLKTHFNEVVIEPIQQPIDYIYHFQSTKQLDIIHYFLNLNINIIKIGLNIFFYSLLIYILINTVYFTDKRDPITGKFYKDYNYRSIPLKYYNKIKFSLYQLSLLLRNYLIIPIKKFITTNSLIIKHLIIYTFIVNGVIIMILIELIIQILIYLPFVYHFNAGPIISYNFISLLVFLTPYLTRFNTWPYIVLVIIILLSILKNHLKKKEKRNETRLIDFINNKVENNVMIQGRPGYGKTVLLTGLGRWAEVCYIDEMVEDLVRLENQLNKINFEEVLHLLNKNIEAYGRAGVEETYLNYPITHLYSSLTYNNFLNHLDIKKMFRKYLENVYHIVYRGTMIHSNYPVKSKSFETYSRIFNMDHLRKYIRLNTDKSENPYEPYTIILISEYSHEQNAHAYKSGNDKKVLNEEGHFESRSVFSHAVERKGKILTDQQSINQTVGRIKQIQDQFFTLQKKLKVTKGIFWFPDKINDLILNIVNKLKKRYSEYRIDQTLFKHLLLSIGHTCQKIKEYIFFHCYVKVCFKIHTEEDEIKTKKGKKQILRFRTTDIFKNDIFKSDFLRKSYAELNKASQLKYQDLPCFSHVDPSTEEELKTNMRFIKKAYEPVSKGEKEL